MPRQKSNLPPVLRVRENQRRSRARRAQLITELQEQVRDRDKQELQSSRLIQLAARRVAWENERLRELLAVKGVSGEEIDGFLGIGGGSQTLTASRHMSVKGAPMSTGPLFGYQAEQPGYQVPEGVIQSKFDKVVASTNPQASMGNTTFLEMSCETAASIIAGMRGNGSEEQEQARLDLGCKKDQDCKVQNVKVLQVLEIG